MFWNYDFNKWISIHITYWLTIALSTISNNQDSHGHSQECWWAKQIIKPSKFLQTVWFQLGCISVCKTSEPFNLQLCWMPSPLFLWSSVWEILNRFCTNFVASWLSSFETWTSSGMPTEDSEWKSIHQCTSHWASIMVQFWMNHKGVPPWWWLIL